MCFSASRRRRAESFLYRRVSAPLSRFALGKFPGPRGGHTSPLCSAKAVWRAFALCSGKVAGRGLSRFALAKPGGPHFRALLWRSPPGGRTFGLCSGEVRCAGGLSDFALEKSVGRVDFRTLLWRSPSARWTFGLCSGEVQARRSAFALCSGKVNGRGPSFALCSGEAPPGHTFPLCSGEVTRRALSRFALGKCVVCDKGLRRFR